MMPIVIEPNKFYRLRNGEKMRCYAVDGTPPYNVHGAHFDSAGGSWFVASWTFDGLFRCYRTGSFDIVGEWVEPHPCDGLSEGDPVWVRNKAGESWFLRVFLRLLDGVHVVARDSVHWDSECCWAQGKPFVKGEQP